MQAIKDRFPGLDCPGLIEAIDVVHFSSFPRGGFPGLDCPGLIEAN